MAQESSGGGAGRPTPTTSARRRTAHGTRLRWLLAGLGIAALVGAPLAVGAATGDPVIGGKTNPPTARYLTPTGIRADVKSYGLSVSNRNASGGGARLTCVSTAGGTPLRNEPCLRSANRGAGLAFEFAFNGALGGTIQVGGDLDRPFPDVRPFVTNATGVATGLNADQVDGQHAADIINTAVERASVKVGSQGPQGVQGPPGPKGESGARGPQGAPGTPLVAAASTPAAPLRGGKRVVDLPTVAASSAEPTAGGTGASLVPAVQLDEGTYVVQVTFRAFDLDGANTSGGTQYGVASVFLDTTNAGTIWTPDVPSDGANAAQGSSTIVVTVPSGGGSLSVKGVLRSAVAPLPTGSVAQGGADVVVTQVNPLT